MKCRVVWRCNLNGCEGQGEYEVDDDGAVAPQEGMAHLQRVQHAASGQGHVIRQTIRGQCSTQSNAA